MGTAVDAGVFLFKLGYLIEPQYFAIHWTVHLHFPMYISHSNTFLPTINHLFLSQYGIKVYEGGKDWTRKYHKSKPLQLVTTNISLFEKELQNKEFLSWVILWTDTVSSWNWVILLGSKNPLLLFGLYP